MKLPPDSRHDGPRSTHELVLRLTIDGEPLPKQRPRVLRSGRSYTPARTRAAEELIQWECASAMARLRLDTITEGALALTARFYRGSGRTADLDNLLKLTTDALNGVLWRDDRLIIQLHASRFDRQERPRTELAVYRVIECAR